MTATLSNLDTANRLYKANRRVHAGGGCPRIRRQSGRIARFGRDTDTRMLVQAVPEESGGESAAGRAAGR